MPRSKRSKRVTPARVKAATRAILRDSEMLRRVRRVEQQSHAGAFHDEKVDYRSVAVAAPVAVGRVSRAVGLKDFTVDFNAVVANVYVGNGTLGTTDAIYFQFVMPGVTVPVATIATEFPVAVGNWNANVSTNAGGYGVSYMFDVMRHFRYKSFDRLVAHIEPIGYGANTNNSISYAVAPIAGGNETWENHTSTSTLAPYTASQVRTMKGGIETPSYQATVIDLLPYVMTPGMARGRPTECLFLNDNLVGTGVSSNIDAQKIPCGLCIGGQSAGGIVGARGQSIGLLTISGRMRLHDFIGVFAENGASSASPAKSAVEEKAAPRSDPAVGGQNSLPPPPPLRRTEPGDVKDVDFVDPVALPTSSYLMSGGTFSEWKKLSEKERLVWLSDGSTRDVKRSCSVPSRPVSILQ
jgi:hypothetical protein